MEIKTHVLTNTQHLDAGRQQTARGNIGAASQDDLTALGQVVDGKVDKEEGKGLSTNDFTNEEKSNLADAFNDRHTHENKDLLDGIDSYVSSAETDGTTLTIHQTTGDIEFTGETNVIESISQNGTPLEIVDKNVNITETIQSISVNGTQQTITDHNVDIHIDTPVSPYNENPEMDGTATPGQSSAYARGDHAHPSDTTKADKVSGATPENFAGLDANGNLTDSGSKAADFATAAQGALAETAYQKPAGGIPNTDLSEGVQTSLGKADTALQEHQDISGKEDTTNKVTSWGEPTDVQYPSAKLVKDSLDGKVDKVNGKGLSTEDYTTADKTKLAGIEEGAQVNTIETIKVNDTALTPDANKAVNIDLSGYKTTQTAVADPTAEGTGLSFIDSASQNANGEMTVTKKTVQDGTTSQKGVVQLEDSHESTSTTTAATPKNVKEAYDLASGKQDPITFDGEYDPDTNPAATVSTVTTAIAGKADKVSGATSGNFAGLDANGNLTDSGSKATDFATAAQGAKADTAIQGVEINHSGLTPDENNVVTITVAESDNGYIEIAGDPYKVYEHPAPDPTYPMFDTNMWKVAIDDKGHTIVTGSKIPVAVTDTDIANLGVFDSAHPYVSATNKGATVEHVTNAVTDAIAALDSDATSIDGTNVQVKVTQTDGEISEVSVTTDNTVNATDVNNAITTAIASKADKVSGATSGNFAGLDANGNLTDSGSKAADFATAAQGTKADTAIQGVKANGTSLSPDSNKVVDIPTVTTSSDGLMTGADKTKLDGITDYIVSASASGRTLTLTPKNGEPVEFEDTGDTNIIEHVTVNGTEVSPVNKTVAITVPTANDGKLKIKLGSAEIVDTGFSANKSTDVTVTIPNATTGATGVDGLMSVADKTKLDGIEAGADVNTVESVAIGNGAFIYPTAGTTNIRIPMATYDDSESPVSYTNGAMSGQDKEKLDNLNNFSSIVITDGTSTEICEPSGPADTLTVVAGNNVNITRSQDTNTITIDAVGGNTVSAGRSISIVETSTATGTDYEVSVDGAVGYYGSMTTINNITTSPTDLLDASATPNVNSGNDRFVIALNQTDNHVYLYALKTVKDALDPTNDVAGVDVFTLSFNVQVHRTQAHGFYGMAGVQLIRDSSAAIVLHSSTESYPSNVGECSVNGSTTVWNNAGNTTTLSNGKDYYGYRLIYVGDTSLGASDTIQVDARFSVVENMSGIAEYTGSITQYTGGSAIEIDANTHEVSVKPGDGLVVDTTTNTLAVNVKADGGIRLYSDGLGVSLGLDEVTEEVVETVQEMADDMASKLTTNFPYPMITDVSYDFGSLNVGGSCICQLFSVPFRHPIIVDETYVMIYIKDRGYSQSNVMFGIYQYDPAGNNNTGKTDFICDTGAVSIAKPNSEKDILEFPIKHVNSDANFRALRPDCMYYAVLAMPPSAGSGIFLASAPNYNDTVNSMPTLNWRITNCSLITWNDPTNATLDETQVHWWDSGYNEHESMNRFFMQIRNHLPQNNSNNGGNGE